MSSVTSHKPVKVLIWEKGEKSGRREKIEFKTREIGYLPPRSSPIKKGVMGL